MSSREALVIAAAGFLQPGVDVLSVAQQIASE